jgi:hypothetical protein
MPPRGTGPPENYPGPFAQAYYPRLWAFFYSLTLHGPVAEALANAVLVLLVSGQIKPLNAQAVEVFRLATGVMQTVAPSVDPVTHNRLEAALSRLDDETRLLMALVFDAELTYADAAEVLGSDEAFVAGEVIRAVAALNELLKEAG